MKKTRGMRFEALTAGKNGGCGLRG